MSDQLRYEENRVTFLKAVEYLRTRGGKPAWDYLTDGEPAELNRRWMDDDPETFRAYLTRRCKEALAAVREAA